MSTALVPLGDDAARIDKVRRRARVQFAYMGQALTHIATEIGRVLVPAFKSMAMAFTDTFALMVRAGVIRPPVIGLAHGTLWTSPISGKVWRVRGRRGRPHTFHWGPVGPQRADRMLS